MGYNHYDIAHAWANNMDSYRGNSSHSMSHSSTRLYSYGTVIGQWIPAANGEILWLVQNATYSSSTAKHQGYMRNAMTGGPTVDVSKYGFKYGWDGVSTGYYYQRDIIWLCVGFIESFYDLLARIPNSKTIKSEDISAPIKEINTLIQYTGQVTWKKLISRDWGAKRDRQKAIGLRKLTKALSEGIADISQLVIAVFGEKSWFRYIAQTLPQQKARETRRAKTIPGYVPMDFENIDVAEIIKSEAAAAKARQQREAQKALKQALQSKSEWLDNKSHHIFIPNLTPQLQKKVFDGGNVLLRISGKLVETSKGIKIPLDECQRLWSLVNRWHNNATTFTKEMCHSQNGRWVISSYQDDILTSGCHSIAYSEMHKIAKELNFI